MRDKIYHEAVCDISNSSLPSSAPILITSVEPPYFGNGHSFQSTAHQQWLDSVSNVSQDFASEIRSTFWSERTFLIKESGWIPGSSYRSELTKFPAFARNLGAEAKGLRNIEMMAWNVGGAGIPGCCAAIERCVDGVKELLRADIVIRVRVMWGDVRENIASRFECRLVGDGKKMRAVATYWDT